MVFGSLRVLKDAKDRGIIAHVKPTPDELITVGTYMSDTLYQAFLYDPGEA
jgi:predicted nucleic acid-binding protein